MRKYTCLLSVTLFLLMTAVFESSIALAAPPFQPIVDRGDKLVAQRLTTGPVAVSQIVATATLTAATPISVTPGVTTTAAVTATPLATLAAPIGLISPTVPFSTPVVVDIPTPEPIIVTATVAAENDSSPIQSEPQESPTPGPTSTPEAAASDVDYEAVLEGTILANRTDATVEFFAEGVTYSLAPRRSLGLTLMRATAIVNLFNCDAATSAEDEACFWDPYLVEQDGFYEVINGAAIGQPLNLILEEAGSPPANQVWIQNRTGKREILVYEGTNYELPPSAVQEFTVPTDAPALVHMRACVVVEDESRCEWVPQSVEPGIYYLLVELTTAGTLPNSQVTTLELEELLGESDTPLEDKPFQLLCRLQVPAVNVRSGPGLQYLIIAKVRGAVNEPASVLVAGRTETGAWLAVDERVAQGGWVTGNSSFVVCDGDVAQLPLTEITDGRLGADVAPPAPKPDTQAAPQPAAAAQAEPGATGSDTEQAPEEQTEAQNESGIPDGLSMLIVENTFEGHIRFTLDQKFRVEEGPSEFELDGGQGANILVYPGLIRFSASSNWRAENLSGNAEFTVAPDEAQNLWVTFIPDPDGSGRFDMQWQWP